jgi:hypothetical protein
MNIRIIELPPTCIGDNELELSITHNTETELFKKREQITTLDSLSKQILAFIYLQQPVLTVKCKLTQTQTEKEVFEKNVSTILDEPKRYTKISDIVFSSEEHHHSILFTATFTIDVPYGFKVDINTTWGDFINHLKNPQSEDNVIEKRIQACSHYIHIYRCAFPNNDDIDLIIEDDGYPDFEKEVLNYAIGRTIGQLGRRDDFFKDGNLWNYTISKLAIDYGSTSRSSRTLTSGGLSLYNYFFASPTPLQTTFEKPNRAKWHIHLSRRDDSKHVFVKH